MNLKNTIIICTMICASITAIASESYYVDKDCGAFIGDAEHFTDLILADGIAEFLHEEGALTVVDFGCGDGHYVNRYIQHGLDAVGYDANPVTEDASGGTCFVLDLSVPVDLGKKFDWVHSLETGEHLPKQFERIFIENLTRHVKDGLILSWAKEGQGGIGHFNERNDDYIKKIFAQMGWYNDIVAERRLRNAATIAYFKDTIMVFRPNKP